MQSCRWRVAAAGLALSIAPCTGAAQTALSGPPIHISRATSPIVIDGSLADEGWADATRVERWYEINPGDNVEPKVRSVAYLAYDDRFFYAAFEFDDPDPSRIRAPLGDRDNLPSFTDYGGLMLDTRNDGHSAMEFLANARGVQFDAIQDDTSGEDPSPDFFWDSAARITPRGWTLEIRIPFSTLRYRGSDPQAWGVLLFRNYPREFHYQIASSRLPRGGNCFICRANTLTGLAGLPAGGHLVAAPYLAGNQTALPSGDLGTPLATGTVHAQGGADLKWTPNAENAFDLTIKPDFSQIEADTAQISANERFALFFPEKRPFFLEGVNLFSTPIQAVYTRTITNANGGARFTGKVGDVAYTALFAQDAGGGTVIVPGPNGSSAAPQDFTSTVMIGRAKREIGRSYVSVLMTDREAGADGHNRVVGPDFEWRHAGEVVRGQWLVSDTRTPNRADLFSDWTGQAFTSSAAQLQWSHNTRHFDAFGLYKDYGDGFRADAGFVPQAGFREEYGNSGWTFRPNGLFSRIRTFLGVDRQTDRNGALVVRDIQPGAGMDTRWNGFLQFRYDDANVRAGDRLIGKRQFVYVAQVSPSRRFSQIGLNGTIGGDVDFANARPARGANVNLSASLHPTDHLELLLLRNERRLNVDDARGQRRRLFTAQVSRVRGTYSFTARAFVRVVVQYVDTDRDPTLYTDPTTTARSAFFSGSALVAYKLNWQSVLFVGYGDDRQLTSDETRLARADRQVFVKISYAIQH